MTSGFDGNAVVYCEGAFATPNGKTAHGLVRRSHRYQVASVVDSTLAGQGVDSVLPGTQKGIPIVSSLQEALERAAKTNRPLSHFVIGLAPDGGRLPQDGRLAVKEAIRKGLHVDSGLHDFLSEDPELVQLAQEHGVRLRDIRKPPARKDLHFFSGKIDEVQALRVAVLGTDSAVGKRTTAWMLVDELMKLGKQTDLIGTGQTAWMQGAKHSIILDSLVNDFVTGEIEHAIWQAWNDQPRPEVLILEGQGSLLNPAYPGGFELLAAGRPHALILQHAPARKTYDGFPNYPLHPLSRQIEALRVICDAPLLAITINQELLSESEVKDHCQAIEDETGILTRAPLLGGVKDICHQLANLKPPFAT